MDTRRRCRRVPHGVVVRGCLASKRKDLPVGCGFFSSEKGVVYYLSVSNETRRDAGHFFDSRGFGNVSILGGYISSFSTGGPGGCSRVVRITGALDGSFPFMEISLCRARTNVIFKRLAFAPVNYGRCCLSGRTRRFVNSGAVGCL